MDRVNGARSDFSGLAGAVRASASTVKVPIAAAARKIQLGACVRAVLVSVSACAPPLPRPPEPAGRPRSPSAYNCWERDARRRTCMSRNQPPCAPPARPPAFEAREPNNTGLIINNNISHCCVILREICVHFLNELKLKYLLHNQTVCHFDVFRNT